VRRLVPFLLLGLLLAAGCGSSSRLSKDAYRARLAALNREVDKAESKARSAVTSSATVDQIRSALSQVAASQQHVGDEVAKLKPPKEAEAANAHLARAAHDLAAEIRATVKKLGPVENRVQALGLVQTMLQSAHGASELDQAVGELRRLGFWAES
jgi:hypothetical protein